MFPLTWSSLPGAWRGGEPACPAPGTWWWGACSRGEGWEWRGTHGARRVMPHARAPPAPQRTPLPGRLFPPGGATPGCSPSVRRVSPATLAQRPCGSRPVAALGAPRAAPGHSGCCLAQRARPSWLGASGSPPSATRSPRPPLPAQASAALSASRRPCTRPGRPGPRKHPAALKQGPFVWTFCVQAFIAAPGGERGRVHAAETVRSVGLCRSLRVMEACPGQGHAPLSCGAGRPGARGGPSRSSSSVAVVTVPLSSSGWLRAEQGSRGTSRLPSRQPVKCVPTPHVCRRGRSE